jgi:hypothetical protein
MTDNNHLAWIDEKITLRAKSTLKYLWSIVGPIAKSDLGPQSVCVRQCEVSKATGADLEVVEEDFRTLKREGWILRIDKQGVPNRKGRSTRLAWKAPDAFGLLNAAETVGIGNHPDGKPKAIQAKQIEFESTEDRPLTGTLTIINENRALSHPNWTIKTSNILEADILEETETTGKRIRIRLADGREKTFDFTSEDWQTASNAVGLAIDQR